MSFDNLPRYSSYEKIQLPHHKIEHSQRTKDLIEIANFCDALSHNHSMIESYEMEMTTFLDKSDIRVDIDLNRNESSTGRLKQHTVEEFITTKSSNKRHRPQSKRMRRNKFNRFLDDDTSDSDRNNSQDITDKGNASTTHSKLMEKTGSQLPVLHSDTDDDNLNYESHTNDIKENKILSNSDDDYCISEKLNNLKDNKHVSKLLNQSKNVLTEVTNHHENKINLKYNMENTNINSDNNLFKELQINDEIANTEDDISDELMSSLPEVEFISKKQEISGIQEFKSDNDIAICPPPEIDYMLLNRIGNGREENLNGLEMIETENKSKSPNRSTDQMNTTKDSTKVHQTVTPTSYRSVHQIDTINISPKAHQIINSMKGDNDSTNNLFDDDIDDSLLLYATESDCNPCGRNDTPNQTNHQIIKDSEKEQNPIPQPVTNKVSQKQNDSKTDQIPRPSIKLASQHNHSNNEIEKNRSHFSKAILDTNEDDDEIILNVAMPQSNLASKKVHHTLW